MRAVPPPAASCDPATLSPVSQQLPFNTCVSNAACRLLETLAWTTARQRHRFDAEQAHQCVLTRPLHEGIVDSGKALGTFQREGLPGEGHFQPPMACPNPPQPRIRLGRWWRLNGASDVKGVIAVGQPILASMTTNEEFADVRDFSVWRDRPGLKRLVHAILLVGYDDNGGFWVVQNSFGTGWGQQGFGRVAYGESSILSDKYHSAFAAA